MTDIIQLRIAITWIADISALTSYLATASMTTNSNIASIISQCQAGYWFDSEP
jgi:hypothetical protein